MTDGESPSELGATEVQPICQSHDNNSTSDSLMSLAESRDALSDDLGLEIVDIFVGPTLTPFKIHEKRLTKKSMFFENMLHGQFKEAIERTVRLPDDDPLTFNLFLKWLYAGGLDKNKSVSNSQFLFELVRLYSFAEKICQTDLMDCCMTSIMRTCRVSSKLLKTDTMIWAYNHTAPDSQLRRFVAQTFVYVLHQGENKKKEWSVADLSGAISTVEDLRVDVLRLLRRDDACQMMRYAPDALDFCTFHTHEKGVACAYDEP